MTKTKGKRLIQVLLGVLLISTLLFSVTPVFAAGNRMYVQPAAQTVDPGESFTVEIYVETDVMTRGAACDIQFDPALVQVDSISEGTFYSSWAAAQGKTTLFTYVGIDNVNGIVNDAGVVIVSAAPEGPTGSGAFLVLNMTAVSGVDGNSAITLVDTKISDVNVLPLTHTVEDGVVTVGQPSGPDLVVSALSTEWVDEEAGTYNIVYTVTNQGSAAADASTTEVDIDGATTTYACPALDVSVSDTQTVGPFTIADGEDIITVTADIAGTVAEGNESNNSKAYTLSPSAMIVEGNTVGNIIITIPDSILDWVLEVGDNSQAGTLNVKCNTDWQVTISDDNPTTGGHMTEWDGAIYGSEYLDEALTVACAGESTDVDLETSGIIANGELSGQQGNDGEDFDLAFNQTVEFDDPVLPDGSVYRIVITFTGSMTF